MERHPLKKQLTTKSRLKIRLSRKEIGPAVIKNDGNNYETNKITIKTNSTQASKKTQKEKDYFLVSSIDRNELILNETIELKVKFFNRIRLVEASIEEPESESLFFRTKGKEKSFRKIINGKEYNVTELTYKVYSDKIWRAGYSIFYS